MNKSILLGILTFLAFQIQAQQWQSYGPYGGEIFSLVNSGDTVYAGGFGGVYMSVNGGGQWRATGYINAGMVQGSNNIPGYVTSLTISDTGIWAGTYGGGLYLSTNQGQSWTSVSNGISNAYISALLAVGPYIYAGTEYGLFVSSDKGNTFTAITSGLNTDYITCFATIGTNVFAGTINHGPFLSTDSGTVWTAVNTGMSVGYVEGFAVIGTEIYAATTDFVYHSTNNGGSWSQAENAGLNSPFMNTITASGSNLFASSQDGLYYSNNGGGNWTLLNNGIPNVQIYSILVNGGSIFAGGYWGVYASTDNGQSWSAENAGMDNTDISSLFYSNGKILAGSLESVFYSTDSGYNWLNTGAVYYGNTYSIVSAGSYLYAGSANGVLISNDNGASWILSDSGFTDSRAEVSGMAVSGGGDTVFAATDYGIYFSTDNGGGWTALNNGLPAPAFVYTLTVNGKYLFTGTWGTGKMSVSNNGGASWTDDNNGLPVGNGLNALANNGTTIFAGTNGGLYISSNNGASWSAAPGNIGTANVLSLYVSQGLALAGTLNSGIFYSTDGGFEWTQINAGLPEGVAVSSIVVADSIVYAGTLTNGIWQRPLSQLNCNLASPTITAATTSFCSNDSIQVCAPSGFTTYQWSQANAGNVNCVEVHQSGTWLVTVTDPSGCIAVSDSLVFTVNQIPSINLLQSYDTLIVTGADSAAVQWLNCATGQIAGTGTSLVLPGITGDYAPIVSNGNCSDTGGCISVLGLSTISETNVQIFPNPTIDNWVVSVDNSLLQGKIQLFDASGRAVFESEIENLKTEIRGANLPAGAYTLRIYNEAACVVKQVVRVN